MGTSEDTARFAFEVDSSGVQAGTNAGVASLEKFQDQLEADEQAVKNLQQAIRLLRGATSGNAETLDAMNKRLVAAKNSMAGTAAQIIKMNGALHKGKKPAEGGGGKPSSLELKDLIGLASKSSGPLGSLARVAHRAAGGLGKAGIAGAAVLAAAALVAIPTAVGAAVAALTRLAIGFADVRRAEMITLEGMTRVRNWWGYIPGKASEVRDAIDKVSDSTSTSREKIAEYAQTLYRAGLRGGDLSSMLEAVSMKSSIQGENQAQRFLGMAYGARMLGYSVKQMADTAKARLQDLNAKQIIGFDVQVRKLRENLPRLFDSVKMEGFLKAMRKVTELFSVSSITGKGLQAAIGSIFTTILGQSAGTGNVFKRLVQGMVLGLLRFSNGLLKLEIGWLRIKKSFKSLFPDGDKNSLVIGFKAAKIFENALWGVLAVSTGIAISLGVIAAAGITIGAIAVSLNALGVAALGVATIVGAAAISLLLAPIFAIANLGTKLGSYCREQWSITGQSIVQGIIDGITAKFTAAKNAIFKLAGNLKKWFNEALEIHSPSKAFQNAAGNIPKGVARGIDSAKGEPQSAVQNMVSPSDMGGGQGSPGASRAPIQITIGDINIKTSASSFTAAAPDIEATMSNVFELLAIQMGAR